MHAQERISRESLTKELRKANDSVENVRRKLEAFPAGDVRRSQLEESLRLEQNKFASIAHRLARLV